MLIISYGMRLSGGAALLPSSRQGMASLSGAALVHALMLVCGVQFAAVYLPARWAAAGPYTFQFASST